MILTELALSHDLKQSRVWKKHALHWAKIGVPLKPSVEDARLMLSSLQPLFENSDLLKIAVLGVTPEIVNLSWPNNVSLYAYDHSVEMIESLWKPNLTIPYQVQLARWQQLPVKDDTFNAIVGDNSFGVLPDALSYHQLLSELNRVLIADGFLCFRFFIKPEQEETIEDVKRDVLAKKITNFHVLKWRIAMLMAEEPEFRVHVSQVYTLFNQLFPDRYELSALTGWALDVINTIDAYYESETCFNFVTLDALKNIVDPWFEIVALHYAEYELGERCPTILMQKK